MRKGGSRVPEKTVALSSSPVFVGGKIAGRSDARLLHPGASPSSQAVPLPVFMQVWNSTELVGQQIAKRHVATLPSFQVQRRKEVTSNKGHRY